MSSPLSHTLHSLKQWRQSRIVRQIDKYTARAMSSVSTRFVSRCLHSMKSFVCLHLLSGAPYLLNSSYIRQLTFRLYLMTEIRIVRQINNKIDSEGNELNQCIKIQPFLFRFQLFAQWVFLRVSSLITRLIFSKTVVLYTSPGAPAVSDWNQNCEANKLIDCKDRKLNYCIKI